MPYKGVTSTDSEKTQIFYTLDFKSYFPHHLMGPHTKSVEKLVYAEAYRSHIVPYPSSLSDSTSQEVSFFSRKPHNSKNGGIGATKDT